MKISEATTKICPFMSRPITTDHQLYFDGALIEVNCIADKCMSWEFDNILGTPNKYGISVVLSKSTDSGYCIRCNKYNM